LAKIAVALQQALKQRALTGAGGRASGRLLAMGEGWKVEDVICTHGPQDRPFAEQHRSYTIAMVVAGSFQYRGRGGHELMTPGSFVLGSAGQEFECGHQHGAGDRCIAFSYTPEYFERLAGEAGVRSAKPDFQALRLPPLRVFSPLVARAAAGAVEHTQPDAAWEELGLRLAAQTLELLGNGDLSGPGNALPSSEARVTRALRRIERHLPTPTLENRACWGRLDVSLNSLACEAGLSPYHFLRAFEGVTGVTPHQYILRWRLREAALRLSADCGKISDVALDCGFGDVSNFNRTFRAEFGVSPREYRGKLPKAPKLKARILATGER
jgi:AraC family transcriptional regulator